MEGVKMFGLFERKEKAAEAKIFFGSTEATKERLEERRSPFDKSVVSKAPQCDAEDTLKALKIAQEAAKETRRVPLSQRILWLEDVAKKLQENREDFAMMLAKEVAKPIAFSRVEVDRCAETIKITAMELANLHGETLPTDLMPSGKQTTAFFRREPVGVVACITPFNFPLNLVAHKIAPALGAGNAVVLKPTPEAPMTAYMLAKLFVESEYAVKDALSVVYGDVEVDRALHVGRSGFVAQLEVSFILFQQRIDTLVALRVFQLIAHRLVGCLQKLDFPVGKDDFSGQGTPRIL